MILGTTWCCGLYDGERFKMMAETLSRWLNPFCKVISESEISDSEKKWPSKPQLGDKHLV